MTLNKLKWWFVGGHDMSCPYENSILKAASLFIDDHLKMLIALHLLILDFRIYYPLYSNLN